MPDPADGSGFSANGFHSPQLESWGTVVARPGRAIRAAQSSLSDAWPPRAAWDAKHVRAVPLRPNPAAGFAVQPVDRGGGPWFHLALAAGIIGERMVGAAEGR